MVSGFCYLVVPRVEAGELFEIGFHVLFLELLEERLYGVLERWLRREHDALNPGFATRNGVAQSECLVIRDVHEVNALL